MTPTRRPLRASALIVTLVFAAAALVAAPRVAVADPTRAPATPELERLAAEQATVAVIVAAGPGFTWPGLARFGDGTYLRGVIPADTLDALRAAPGVTYVEADVPLEVDGAPANDQVDANVLDAAGQDGTNRTVAVIDSGVDFTHPALASANRGEACFESAAASCPGGTTSSVGPGSAAPVGASHGTFVAGMVGSRDATYPGAANDAGIYAVRIFPPGAGTTAQTSDLIAAMQHVRAVAPSHAAAGRPIVAINASLGAGGPSGPCPGGPTAAEVQAVANAGITPVISSGNDGFTNGVSFPGCVPAAFTVGAVIGEHVSGGSGDGAQDDTLASYSNAGASIDVLAPGGSASTVPGGFAYGQGTSFAAPVVSAVFADLAEARPGSTRGQREAAVAKSGPFVSDPRVAGGGYGRFRVDADDALNRLDEILARDPNGFTPITPARVFSSSAGLAGSPTNNGAIGAGQLPGGTDWYVDVAGALGLAPGDIKAVALNLTAHDTSGPGYLAVWPDSTAWPGTSALNLQPGQIIASAQYTPTGPAGGVTLRNCCSATNVIVDVAGYWGPGADYQTLTPARIFAAQLASGEARFIDPRGVGGVPASGVSAVVLSSATVAYGTAGFLAIVPSDQPESTSVQNFDSSETLAALTVARLGPDGRIKAYNGTNGPIDLYLDAVGYVPNGAGDLVPASPPGRITDTRSCLGACGPVGAQSYTLVDVTWCGGCKSVVLNLTGITPAAAGHASMLPGPAIPPAPSTSNLNMAPGGVIANLVTVKRGSDGYVRLYSFPSSHYAVDFIGSTT